MIDKDCFIKIEICVGFYKFYIKKEVKLLFENNFRFFWFNFFCGNYYFEVLFLCCFNLFLKCIFVVYIEIIFIYVWYYNLLYG